MERLEDILKMIKRYDMTPLRYNFGLIHTRASDLGEPLWNTRPCLKPSLMRNYLWNWSRYTFLFLIKRLLLARELIRLTYAGVIVAFIIVAVCNSYSHVFAWKFYQILNLFLRIFTANMDEFYSGAATKRIRSIENVLRYKNKEIRS